MHVQGDEMELLEPTVVGYYCGFTEMAYNLLTDITPANKQWNICARVSRLWEYRGGVDHSSIQHLDLVSMHRVMLYMVKFLGRQHVEAEKELLKEGHVYAFSRFLVCPNKSKIELLIVSS